MKRLAWPMFATLALGCAGKPAPDTAANPRRVRVLAAGDSALLPISLAAARYLKSISGSADAGFIGVFHRRELDVKLSREIVATTGLADLTTRDRRRDDDCTAPPRTTNPLPAPTDPARPGAPAAAPVPTTTASPARTCGSSGPSRWGFGFHKYRVTSDSAYVEVSGSPRGSCLILAAEPLGGWSVVEVKPARPDACGR